MNDDLRKGPSNNGCNVIMSIKIHDFIFLFQLSFVWHDVIKAEKRKNIFVPSIARRAPGYDSCIKLPLKKKDGCITLFFKRSK